MNPEHQSFRFIRFRVFVARLCPFLLASLAVLSSAFRVLLTPSCLGVFVGRLRVRGWGSLRPGDKSVEWAR